MKEFKCKDEIIYRLRDTDLWQYGIFSHYNVSSGDVHIVGGVISKNWKILPYEDNQHLVGTTDNPEEEITLEQGELVVVSEMAGDISVGSIRHFSKVNNDFIYCYSTNEDYTIAWHYCIPFKDYNINDIGETKKHILHARNGKLVRYGK